MLDNTDKKILNELTKNSRITMKELGGKIHLTGAATAARVAKLEDNGVIESYSINVNQNKLDCYMHVFMNIFLNDIHHKAFIEWLKEKDQFVLNSFRVSGDGCYLLECRFPSNEYLNDFLDELNRYANYKLSSVIDKL
ncbi:Lrp/AsnC family transcriptional regulator [Terribacillus aidingensis]|uniref:Lrp/AsnC family transcriptional regulator n=1 Tax=Terribacillus aidingensis TaxID=586416 RepID=UPI0034504501